MSSNEEARRAPFTPKDDSCPDLSGELPEISAELPDFCGPLKSISVLWLRPRVPIPPDIPVFSCPCPESASDKIWFSKSDDCCDWTLHFKYTPPAIPEPCIPGFTMCECKKKGGGCHSQKTGVDWPCCDVDHVEIITDPRTGAKRAIDVLVCDVLKPGEIRLITGDGECPGYRLIYKPPKSTTSTCVAEIEEFEQTDGYGDTMSFFGGGTMSFHSRICLACDNQIDSDGTIKDKNCSDFSFSISIPGIPKPDVKCDPHHITLEDLGCMEKLWIDSNKPVYIGEGAVMDAQIVPLDAGTGVKFQIKTCERYHGQGRLSDWKDAGTWEIATTDCSDYDSE